jgi:hypothetical protein
MNDDEYCGGICCCWIGRVGGYGELVTPPTCDHRTEP